MGTGTIDQHETIPPRRPVALPALATAAVFAAVLVASIYGWQRNEDAIAQLTTTVELGPGRVSVLKNEIAMRQSWRTAYWTTIGVSFAGIAAALALGTLRRR